MSLFAQNKTTICKGGPRKKKDVACPSRPASRPARNIIAPSSKKKNPFEEGAVLVPPSRAARLYQMALQFASRFSPRFSTRDRTYLVCEHGSNFPSHLIGHPSRMEKTSMAWPIHQCCNDRTITTVTSHQDLRHLSVDLSRCRTPTSAFPSPKSTREGC
jgi:hypothetical protein